MTCKKGDSLEQEEQIQEQENRGIKNKAMWSASRFNKWPSLPTVLPWVIC